MSGNSNYNDDFVDDSSWENLFEMAETFEKQKDLPVYENVNFYESSAVKEESYHTPEEALKVLFGYDCNGVQREHNKKLNNGLPILHKVPPKRDYGRYFCIMAEKGGTSHGA